MGLRRFEPFGALNPLGRCFFWVLFGNWRFECRARKRPISVFCHGRSSTRRRQKPERVAQHGGMNGCDVPAFAGRLTPPACPVSSSCVHPACNSQRRHIYSGSRTRPAARSSGSPAGGPTLHCFALGGGSGWTCVQSDDYWSGTEYAPNPNNALNFNTNNGNQNANNKNNQFYALAVRPGG